MLRYIYVLLLTLSPVTVFADPAPQGCGDHFVSGAMPVATPNRLQKARLLCFSVYAVLHSGLSKTPVWSAEHLTRDSIAAASGIHRRNSFHAEPRLPADERAELSDYKGSGFDRGHMSPSGDMPTEQAHPSPSPI